MNAPMSQDLSNPTRLAAFDLLSAVLDKRRALEDALDSQPKTLDARDKAAAHRLAAAVLRRLGTLDEVLDTHLNKSPPQAVRHILRLGAAELLLLGTPAHAVVATLVDIARARKLTPFTGLVNAVLRKLAAGGPALLEGLDGPRLDTPVWLWGSWGPAARAIAEAHQHEAPIDLSLLPGAAIPPGGTLLPSGSVRFPPGTRVTELPGFAEGTFWVQDAAAALPVRLLAPQAGEVIADLCAAPGGKTAQLVAAGATVTAVEKEKRRIPRLQENLARLHLKAKIVTADAATWGKAETFDAILLDAPCSATGTIRRHPDVPRMKRISDIAALNATQSTLLAAAARLLKPGGRLVYAVCSMQPEEGEARIAAALQDLPFKLAPFTAEELAFLPEARTEDGYLRTHPGMWTEQGGLDGFFAARLIKM